MRYDFLCLCVWVIETYRGIVNIALSSYVVSTLEFNINVFLYFMTIIVSYYIIITLCLMTIVLYYFRLSEE